MIIRNERIDYLKLEDLLIGKNNHPIDLVSVLTRGRFNFDELSNKLIYNGTYNRLSTVKSDYNIDQSFVRLCHELGIDHSSDYSYRYYINLFYLLTTLTKSDIDKYIKYTYDSGSLDSDFDSSIHLVITTNFDAMIEVQLKRLLNRKVRISPKPIKLIHNDEKSLYNKIVTKYNNIVRLFDITTIDLKLLHKYGVISFIDLSIDYLYNYVVDKFLYQLNDLNDDNDYVSRLVNIIINKNYTNNLEEFFKDVSDIYNDPTSYD